MPQMEDPMPAALRIFFASLLLWMVIPLSPQANRAQATPATPSDAATFLDDVFRRIPSAGVSEYSFQSWEREGRSTAEGIGLLPVANLDAEAIVDKVMDVKHYKGNIDRVGECRSISDGRFAAPGSLRIYQLIDLPVIGDVQHELALVDGGTRDGFRYVFWFLLESETAALDADKAARSAYSMGAWIMGKGMLGYALSSAPRREDVSWASWQALTAGADMTAKTVVKRNLEGMLKWAQGS